MRSIQAIITLTIITFLIAGCAGAYAPKKVEKKNSQGYTRARDELERARAKNAVELAPEEYEQARSTFEEAREELEEFPTEESANKFKEARILAASATIKAQESIISRQEDEITNLEKQLEKHRQIVARLKSQSRTRDYRPVERDREWKQLDLNSISTSGISNRVADTAFYMLRPHLNFPIGQAEITSKHQQILKRVAEVTRQLSNHYLMAVGATDAIPPHENNRFESNRELAARRALNAVNVLLWGYDLEPDKVGSLAMGDYGKLQPETAQMESPAKRRVEFWLLPLNFLQSLPSK